MTSPKRKYWIASARVHSGALAGAASADGATAGRLWVINHVDSNVLMEITRVRFNPGVPAAASTAQTRVTLERVTFTGAPSGAQLTPCLLNSVEAVPSTTSIRTASTGLTLAAGAVLAAGYLGVFLGTPADADVATPYTLFEREAEDKGLVLRAGQGMAVRQADAGDTDQVFTLDIDYDVYRLA